MAFTDGGLRGRIIHIDRFGNLITNIDLAALWALKPFREDRPVAVSVGGQVITGISLTYSKAAVGRPLALIGSRGYLEIAVNCGNAQMFFGVRKTDPVGVRPIE
jgi:hypothetical protein